MPETIAPAPGLASKPGNADHTTPSPEFKQEAEAVKRGRGRPAGSKTKTNAASTAGERIGSPAPAPAIWTPISAGALMQALHLVPAGLTGYDGWVLNQQEMSLCAPLASEVFQELFPADSYWVKLIAFAGVMGGIEIRKFHAYKAWLAQRAPKPTPRAGDAAPKSSPLPSNSGEAAPLPKSDGLKPNIPPLPV